MSRRSFQREKCQYPGCGRWVSAEGAGRASHDRKHDRQTEMKRERLALEAAFVDVRQGKSLFDPGVAEDYTTIQAACLMLQDESGW